MLKKLKPVAQTILQPLADILQSVNPNYITFVGIIFPVLFFIFLVYHWYMWAVVIFVFNIVDMLDGMVARAQKKVTPFGGFLDSTIDRFSDFTIIAGFAFAGLVSWTLAAPLLLLTYLISYIRSRTELAAKATLVADVGIIERTERLVLVFFALLFFILFPGLQLFGMNSIGVIFLILIFLSLITVYQRIYFAYKKL